MLEQLIKQRDEAEEAYIQTHSPEDWADFLSFSIRVAEIESRSVKQTKEVKT